ncbi:hypothetical protein IWX49DRAFT_549345 [Phyllosticta citricarpa]|uniref:Uncharacterized protein n=1 Tax=Phyllosticta citricarpa TaxID=55181 RepID=A0ABR1MUJ4_9PEZI
MPPAPVKDVFVPAPRFGDFEGCTWQAWLDGSSSSRGNKAWLDFKQSIHDGNRTIPRRLALSHWHTVEDFVWISENLPNLTELDLSDIQDCVLIDHTTDVLGYYTWEELRQAVKDKFWAQIEKLWVRHWGCTALQNSLFRHPPARDKSSDLEYRSRRDGQIRESVCDVTTIIGACSKLKVLSVRGPTVGGGLNKAWHPKKSCIEEGGHAHFCALVEGLEDTAPLSMETLELHQAEIGLLLPLLANFWTLKRIKISLASILLRYAPGRIEEDVEDPELEKWPKELASRATQGNCGLELQHKRLAGVSDGEKKQKLHEWLDSAISTSFEMYPREIPGVATKLQADWKSSSNGPSLFHLMDFLTSGPYAHPVRALAYNLDFIAQAQQNLENNSQFQQLTTTESVETCNNIPISPFTFILPDRKIHSPDEIEAMEKNATSTGFKFECNSIFLSPHEPYPTEPMRPIEMWKTLRKTAPGFAPLWDLDALMSQGFPANQGIVASTGSFVDAIARGLLELKRNGIPVRVLLAWRKGAPGLYWGHEEMLKVPFKSYLASECSIPRSSLTSDGGNGSGGSGTPEDGAQQETIKTTIAELVDELVVRYPDWTGGAPSGPEDASAAPLRADDFTKQLHREAQGWQRWWYYHALLFTSMRRLEIRMPEAFDAFHSKRLALVLLGEGCDEGTTASRGKWHLRHNGTGQGTHTRFVSRLWERVGGDKKIVWGDDEWKRTAETFRDMEVFDEEWEQIMPGHYKQREPHASDEQIAESDESNTEMREDGAVPQAVSSQLEHLPSKSPDDVVETIETTDTTMHEAPEMTRAESVDKTSSQVIQRIKTLSAESEPADMGSLGSGKSFDSMFVEPPTSRTVDADLPPLTWDTEDERSASSLVDPSRSSDSTSKPSARARSRSRGREESKAAALRQPAESSRDRSNEAHRSGGPSNPELLAPPDPEVISGSGSGGGSTSKPRPRARSRSRGREGTKGAAVLRSAESSRERRSKRQASEEPEGPAPPTQRRRSKMERELDWSLKK